MSRKFLVALILILFLFPFVSWYYLQRGLTWRKAAQEVMKGTTPFPEVKWEDASGKLFSTKDLEGHVSLVTFMSCESSGQDSVLLEAFYEQFKDTKKANFIILDSCAVKDGPAVTKDKWIYVNCQDSVNLCRTLLPVWQSGKKHAL